MIERRQSTFVVGHYAATSTAVAGAQRRRFIVRARTEFYVTLVDGSDKAHRVWIRKDPHGDEWALPLGRRAQPAIVRPGEMCLRDPDRPE